MKNKKIIDFVKSTLSFVLEEPRENGHPMFTSNKSRDGRFINYGNFAYHPLSVEIKWFVEGRGGSGSRSCSFLDFSIFP